jgi:hypothetical protein
MEADFPPDMKPFPGQAVESQSGSIKRQGDLSFVFDS